MKKLFLFKPLRLVVCLLLCMVGGVGSVWGTDYTVTPITTSAELSALKAGDIIMMKNYAGNYSPCYMSSHTSYTCIGNASSYWSGGTFSDASKAFMWVLVDAGSGQFYLKNYSSNTYIGCTTSSATYALITLTSSATNKYTISYNANCSDTSVDLGNCLFNFYCADNTKQSDSANRYLHYNSSYYVNLPTYSGDVAVTIWTANGPNSHWAIEKVEEVAVGYTYNYTISGTSTVLLQTTGNESSTATDPNLYGWTMGTQSVNETSKTVTIQMTNNLDGKYYRMYTKDASDNKYYIKMQTDEKAVMLAANTTTGATAFQFANPTTSKSYQYTDAPTTKGVALWSIKTTVNSTTYYLSNLSSSSPWDTRLQTTDKSWYVMDTNDGLRLWQYYSSTNYGYLGYANNSNHTAAEEGGYLYTDAKKYDSDASTMPDGKSGNSGHAANIFIEYAYPVYTVSCSEGGVTYGGITYTNGQKIYSTDATVLTSETAVAAEVSGKTGSCEVSAGSGVNEYTITVTYTTETGVKTLWTSAASTLPTYRIPAIAKAKNGNLIAFADKRYDGIDIGWTDTKRVDIVYKVSTDNGSTWSSAATVDEGNDTNSGWDCAFGDAAVVADNTPGNTTDEILVMSVCGTQRFSTATSSAHNCIARNVLTLVDGVWTAGTPEDQSSIFYGTDLFSGDYSMFIGAGKLCQSKYIKNGTHNRVYAPLLAKTPSGTSSVNVNRVVYSDDFGETWHNLGSSKIAMSNTNSCDEPKIEELPDGRVVLSSRVANGRLYRIFTYTNKANGEGSWGDVQKTNFSSSGEECKDSKSTNGEILIVPISKGTDPYYLVLQSLPNASDDASSGRKNLTIKYKEIAASDVSSLTVSGFDTWTGYKDISTTYSAYSSMCLDADNNIAFFYEEDQFKAGSANWADAGYNMKFKTLELSDFNSSYSYREDPLPQAGNIYQLVGNGMYFRNTADNTFVDDNTNDAASYYYYDGLHLTSVKTNKQLVANSDYSITNGENGSEVSCVPNGNANNPFYIKLGSYYIKCPWTSSTATPSLTTTNTADGNKFKFITTTYKPYFVSITTPTGYTGDTRYLTTKATYIGCTTIYNGGLYASTSTPTASDFDLTADGIKIDGMTPVLTVSGTTINVAYGYTITLGTTTNGTANFSGEESTVTRKTVEAGASVTVEATANTGYDFINWTNAVGGVMSSDASYTFTAAGDITLTANFKATDKKSLTIGSTNGTVYDKDNNVVSGTGKGLKWISTSTSPNIQLVGAIGTYTPSTGTETTNAEALEAFSGTSFSMLSAPIGGSTQNLPGKRDFTLSITGAKITGYKIVAKTEKTSFTLTDNTNNQSVTGSTNESKTFTLDNVSESEISFNLQVTSQWTYANTEVLKVSEFTVYYVEEPENIDITIGSTGYASLYYGSYDLTVPENVSAYTYVYDGELKHYGYAAGETIPAGVGVILKGDAGTYTFTASTPDTGANPQPENMRMFGTDKAETTPTVIGDKFYMLSRKDGVLGLYYGVEGGGAFTNAAHKAYLNLSSSESQARTYIPFDFDTPTAIENITSGVDENATIYNIAGQRVANMKNGLYIVNGKKVIK